MIPIRDNVPAANIPVTMWTLIGLNGLAFYGELSLAPDQLEVFFRNFGVVPARFQSGSALSAAPSLLTNMFLHGSLMHLIGNMWTLYLFGDNVEDRMGGGRFAVFYLLCGLAASATHIYTNPGSQIPAIGASGAIAGVMGAYVLMYPRAGIVMVFPFLFVPIFFQISAWLYFGGWFATQYWMATRPVAEPAASGGIAFWAHVGGFVAGVILHRLFLKQELPEPHLEPQQVPFERAWR